MNSIIIETLEGCVEVLKDVDEENHDSRLWVVISALNECITQLDEEDNHEDCDGPSD